MGLHDSIEDERLKEAWKTHRNSAAVSLYGCQLDTFGNEPEHVACVPLKVAFSRHVRTCLSPGCSLNHSSPETEIVEC